MTLAEVLEKYPPVGCPGYETSGQQHLLTFNYVLYWFPNELNDEAQRMIAAYFSAYCKIAATEANERATAALLDRDDAHQAEWFRRFLHWSRAADAWHALAWPIDRIDAALNQGG